jgi:hypothetical protein
LSSVPLKINALEPDQWPYLPPFCPLAIFLSPGQSGRWLVGAVGIEPNAQKNFERVPANKTTRESNKTFPESGNSSQRNNRQQFIFFLATLKARRIKA